METIEKISDTEIKISEPIVKVDVFDIKKLKNDIDYLDSLIAHHRRQVGLLTKRKSDIEALVLKAKNVGVELVAAEVALEIP